MKKTIFLIILASLALFSGCLNNFSQDPSNNSQIIENKKSNLGEFCGGSQAFECSEGLKCEFDSDFEGSGGRCVSFDKIISFEDCIAAGNPIMESYPRQCAADNRTFYEKVESHPQEKICTMEYAPVCGEDGRSYSNKCMAGNVTIAYEGECEN